MEAESGLGVATKSIISLIFIFKLTHKKIHLQEEAAKQDEGQVARNIMGEDEVLVSIQ